MGAVSTIYTTRTMVRGPPGRAVDVSSHLNTLSGTPPGQLARHEYWGEDRTRRLPPGQGPWSEGRREKCRRRILPLGDCHTANIVGRIARGVSLPDKGHGTRVGGGSTGGAPPPDDSHQEYIWGRIDRGVSLPMTEATRLGSAGEYRRRILLPEDSHHEYWGRIDRGSLSLTEATGRGSAGGVPEIHPVPGRPPRRECCVLRSEQRS